MSRAIKWAPLAALVLVLPMLIPSNYYMRLANVALVYMILVLSLNFIFGYTGQIALGHAGFFGIGAYADALISVNYGAPFWIGLMAAGAVSGLFGLALGIPTLRLKGHYLAFATLGFGEIIRHILFNWQGVTRGMDGIGGIPAPSLGLFRITKEAHFYYLILAFVALAVFVSHMLERSKFGRAFMAIRDSEIAAETMGVNTFSLKVQAFILSAVFAGFAGSLYAHLYTYISPDVFTFDVSAAVLAMLLIGGIGTIEGSVLGAILLTLLPEWLRFSKEYYMLIYGGGIVALMVFMPYGIAGLIRKMAEKLYRRRKMEKAIAISPLLATANPQIVDGRIARAEDVELLKVSGLAINFGGLRAVDDLSMCLDMGEIRALIGPNGSGKTTFLNMLSGIYRPSHGTINFAGRDLVGLKPSQITKQGVSRTFQTIRLFPQMTVLQNVMVGHHCRASANILGSIFATSLSKSEEKGIKDIAEMSLDFLGIYGKKAELAKNIPYGQQRLVEVARAMATEPSLIMLDEPSAGMNPNEAGELIDRIEKIRSRGITILLVEHNMQLVMSISDLVSVLDFGKKIAEGKPADIKNDPLVIEAYLGRESKPREVAL